LESCRTTVAGVWPDRRLLSGIYAEVAQRLPAVTKMLLSPLLKPGTVSNTPFNHYSLLKTLEDVFDTDSYLGYAGQAGLLGFFRQRDIGCSDSGRQVKSPSPPNT
jgi:hypothetical protein